MNKQLHCALITNGLNLSWDGTLTPCCNFRPELTKFKSCKSLQEYNDNIRQPLLDTMNNGEFHSGCKKCAEEESINLSSLRLQSNKWYNGITSDRAHEDNPIYDIEMKLSRHCNLRCIMCGPWASTSWIQEIASAPEEFKKLPFQWEIPDKNSIESNFDDRFLRHILKDVSRIDITGGEPLTHPKMIDTLDLLIELGKTDIWLQFCTNATKIPPSLLEKLSKFPNALVSVSLEGTGVKNDYLRYPSKFDEIRDNINLLQSVNKDKKIVGTIHHVLQHTSVYTIPELTEFAASVDTCVTFTVAQSAGDILNISGAPTRDLEKLIEWSEKATWLPEITREPLLGLKSIGFNQEIHSNFRKYVEVLDRIRGTNYDAIFNPSPTY